MAGRRHAPTSMDVPPGEEHTVRNAHKRTVAGCQLTPTTGAEHRASETPHALAQGTCGGRVAATLTPHCNDRRAWTTPRVPARQDARRQGCGYPDSNIAITAGLGPHRASLPDRTRSGGVPAHPDFVSSSAKNHRTPVPRGVRWRVRSNVLLLPYCFVWCVCLVLVGVCVRLCVVVAV